uniref:Uncharacterized protein n=1 Tax=Myoviridae sp. cte0t5 TaxID=2823549 RepID=A0A8S5LGW5_9CAUD|nr:MAG TPA: hypothetical protein [Myoviridae sp. cte0t5]DAI69791.1 MAG TPA: hypothetical protein [Caudoviricetes sp.]
MIASSSGLIGLQSGVAGNAGASLSPSPDFSTNQRPD